jgi:hypothetical protein
MSPLLERAALQTAEIAQRLMRGGDAVMSALCQKRTFWPLFDMIDGSSSRGIVMKLPRRKFLHVAMGATALPALFDTALAFGYPTRPVHSHLDALDEITQF